MEKSGLKIPVWLMALCAFIFIGVVLEQLYIRKTPVDLWGLKLNQPIESEEKITGLVLSDKECSELPGSWVSYQDAGGRMLLVSGAATDENGETKKYSLLDAGGEYSHTLTVPEMPSHSHAQVWGQAGGNLGGKASGNNLQTYTRNKIHDTLSVGGGKPHNNMPPFFVLNLCERN